jgi:hypothetical protein
MEEIEGVAARAVAIATQILQGEIAPHDGGEAFVQMQHEPEALAEGLFPFIGPVSEWERLPEQGALWHVAQETSGDISRITGPRRTSYQRLASHPSYSEP